VMQPYGIVEIVRTGSVAMARGHELLSAAPPLVRTKEAAEHHHDTGVSMSV
jgi:acetolactate synthase-1/3 small subunit